MSVIAIYAFENTNRVFSKRLTYRHEFAEIAITLFDKLLSYLIMWPVSCH